MIPYEFDYYRPDNLTEAENIFNTLQSQGKKAMYYAGGTEIISMARVNNIKTDAVIDIKGIKETRRLNLQGSKLHIGSAVPLDTITESKLFPLLGDTVRRIADHTVQCKVTLGGNILGTIIYREGILPLLLSDASVSLYKDNCIYTKKINEIYDKRINLAQGEILVEFIIDKEFLNLPYIHIKKTKIEKIDYPLITMTAILYNNRLRLAFSGLTECPVRSIELEEIVNRKGFDPNKDIDEIVASLPYPILNNHSGTNKYRVFVLKGLLTRAIEKLI